MMAAAPPVTVSIFLSCMVKRISWSETQSLFSPVNPKILELQIDVVLIMMILSQRGSALDRVYANNCLLSFNIC
jgi:hypothetical protein